MAKNKKQSPAESPAEQREARKEERRELMRNPRSPEDVRRLALLTQLEHVERKLSESSTTGVAKSLLWNPITKTALGVGSGLLLGYAGGRLDTTGAYGSGVAEAAPDFALGASKYIGAGVLGGLLVNKMGGGTRDNRKFYQKRKRELEKELGIRGNRTLRQTSSLNGQVHPINNTPTPPAEAREFDNGSPGGAGGRYRQIDGGNRQDRPRR